MRTRASSTTEDTEVTGAPARLLKIELSFLYFCSVFAVRSVVRVARVSQAEQICSYNSKKIRQQRLLQGSEDGTRM